MTTLAIGRDSSYTNLFPLPWESAPDLIFQACNSPNHLNVRSGLSTFEAMRVSLEDNLLKDSVVIVLIHFDHDGKVKRVVDFCKDHPTPNHGLVSREAQVCTYACVERVPAARS